MEIPSLLEIADLQQGYERLQRTQTLSKKAICDLCIPFRDKFQLSDMEVLQIARKEIDAAKIVEIFKKKEV